MGDKANSEQYRHSVRLVPPAHPGRPARWQAGRLAAFAGGGIPHPGRRRHTVHPSPLAAAALPRRTLSLHAAHCGAAVAPNDCQLLPPGLPACEPGLAAGAKARAPRTRGIAPSFPPKCPCGTGFQPARMRRWGRAGPIGRMGGVSRGSWRAGGQLVGFRVGGPGHALVWQAPRARMRAPPPHPGALPCRNPPALPRRLAPGLRVRPRPSPLARRGRQLYAAEGRAAAQAKRGIGFATPLACRRRRSPAPSQSRALVPGSGSASVTQERGYLFR